MSSVLTDLIPVILRIIIRASERTLSERASTLANSIWTKPGLQNFASRGKGGSKSEQPITNSAPQRPPHDADGIYSFWPMNAITLSSGLFYVYFCIGASNPYCAWAFIRRRTISSATLSSSPGYMRSGFMLVW